MILHGQVVAELVPPTVTGQERTRQLERLIAAGVITPPVAGGDPLANCPDIRLPRGIAGALIDLDRDEG
jgi:hypothetical protein